MQSLDGLLPSLPKMVPLNIAQYIHFIPITILHSALPGLALFILWFPLCSVSKTPDISYRQNARIPRIEKKHHRWPFQIARLGCRTLQYSFLHLGIHPTISLSLGTRITLV